MPAATHAIASRSSRWLLAAALACASAVPAVHADGTDNSGGMDGLLQVDAIAVQPARDDADARWDDDSDDASWYGDQDADDGWDDADGLDDEHEHDDGDDEGNDERDADGRHVHASTAV